MPLPRPQALIDEKASLFWHGIRRNDPTSVQTALAQGVDANLCDAEGHPALVEAVRQGHLALAHLLLDAGADVNVVDPSSQQTALLSLINQDTRTVSEDDPMLLFDRLLNLGANPHVLTRYGQTLLHRLVERSDDTLLDPFVDVATQRLLQAGVDPNVQDRWGQTVLHLAVRRPHQLVALFLNGHGTAALRLQDSNGQIPLHIALFFHTQKTVSLRDTRRHSSWRTLRILLEAGSPLDVADHAGRFPHDLTNDAGRRLIESERCRRMSKEKNLLQRSVRSATLSSSTPRL